MPELPFKSEHQTPSKTRDRSILRKVFFFTVKKTLLVNELDMPFKTKHHNLLENITTYYNKLVMFWSICFQLQI